MAIQTDAMVSYELLSLPMKISQMQQAHTQKMLDSAITSKVQAILADKQAHTLDLFA